MSEEKQSQPNQPRPQSDGTDKQGFVPPKPPQPAPVHTDPPRDTGAGFVPPNPPKPPPPPSKPKQ